MKCNVCSYCVNETNVWAWFRLAWLPTMDDPKKRNKRWNLRCCCCCLYGDTEIAVAVYATREKLRGGMNFWEQSEIKWINVHRWIYLVRPSPEICIQVISFLSVFKWFTCLVSVCGSVVICIDGARLGRKHSWRQQYDRPCANGSEDVHPEVNFLVLRFHLRPRLPSSQGEGQHTKNVGTREASECNRFNWYVKRLRGRKEICDGRKHAVVSFSREREHRFASPLSRTEERVRLVRCSPPPPTFLSGLTDMYAGGGAEINLSGWERSSRSSPIFFFPHFAGGLAGRWFSSKLEKPSDDLPRETRRDARELAGLNLNASLPERAAFHSNHSTMTMMFRHEYPFSCHRRKFRMARVRLD